MAELVPLQARTRTRTGRNCRASNRHKAGLTVTKSRFHRAKVTLRERKQSGVQSDHVCVLKYLHFGGPDVYWNGRCPRSRRRVDAVISRDRTVKIDEEIPDDVPLFRL